jgi:hypothetical protein
MPPQHQPRIPPNGLSYNHGCAFLNSIRWFFELPIAGSGRDNAGIEFLLRGKLLLRGLSHLHHCITRQPFESDSLQQVWDHSGHTQHACLHHMLWEVNSLLDTFVSLISPLFNEVPFFTAAVRTSNDTTEKLVLLSPYYASCESPLETHDAVERTSILTAYATWEERVHTYNRDIGQTVPARLAPAPGNMFLPGTGPNHLHSRDAAIPAPVERPHNRSTPDSNPNPPRNDNQTDNRSSAKKVRDLCIVKLFRPCSNRTILHRLPHRAPPSR